MNVKPKKIGSKRLLISTISAIKIEGVTTGFVDLATVAEPAETASGTAEQLQAAVPAAGCTARAGCITMGNTSGVDVQHEAAATSPAGCVIIGNTREAGWLATGVAMDCGFGAESRA